MITKIIIPAKWDVPQFDGTVLQDNAKAVFKLGLGPCGKVVQELQIELCEHFVEIKQHCEEGFTKTFVYRVADLTGRIEVEEGN